MVSGSGLNGFIIGYGEQGIDFGASEAFRVQGTPTHTGS